MAKLLDVLKKRELSAQPALTPPLVEEEMNRVVEQDEAAFHFIEIDGATRMLAGSPEVLPEPVKLAAPQAAPSPLTPLPHGEGKERDINPAALNGGVVYQPWTASAAITDAAQIAPELLAFHQPDHPLSRQYSALLNQLLQVERPPQALLFTARTAETPLAIPVLNLALAAAQNQDRKVAVLGVERQSASVSHCLALSPAPELQQVLAGKIALVQALQNSPATNLTILPISGHNPALPWNRDALRWVLSWLRGRFDLIFADMGAWTGTPEQIMLAGLCDGVYPVLAGTEGGVEAQQFLRTIFAHGGPVRGTIHIQKT